MAESILFNSAENCLGTVASLAVKEFCLAWGLEDDLKRLETSLSCISAVVSEADEERRNTIWLRRLRDVLYEAEDVLDDFAYQALRNEAVKAHGGINRKVSHFFSGSNPISYRFRIGHQIKDIRSRLDEIAADKAQFDLARQATPPRLGGVFDSYDSNLYVVGRDTERDVIVRFLLDSKGGDENVSVIPIVGMGGIGKTTLVRLVWADERVINHFPITMWVTLGDKEEFNVKILMIKMIQSIWRGMEVDHFNSEQLKTVIQNTLKDRVFFLVLDNMWNVNHTKWLEFKALLSCGAQGSKIVVTTRMTSIASCVGTTSAHNFKGLPHEECVSLFNRFAFVDQLTVDRDILRIGDDIVRKCDGVPLAVKSLANLLFSESNEYIWLWVRKSDMWQIEDGNSEILNSLRLSYNQLPSHLKQCFLYCSLFPRDYFFQDLLLISFWMAHGLLHSRTNQDLQQVGKQYIQELLSRGFFQDFKKHSWCCSFKMHDLMRNLAVSLGQEEFATVDVNDKLISDNTRHVCFEVQSFSASSSNAIRTVLVPNEAFGATFSKTCISKFNLLRVLCLANSVFEELPNSVGALKHLRSFDLRGCRRLKRLPKSINKLHYLETLLLAGCAELEESLLSIEELNNLRWLWISTKQKRLLKSLEVFDYLHFAAFSDCGNLEIFFEGNMEVHLTSLQTLVIKDCKSLVSLFPMSGNSSSGIKYYLPALEVLCVKDCKNLDLDEKEHDVLQLPSLRSLTIQGLALMEGLPQWIQRCATTLRYLKIKDCENLTALPDWLHNLTSLQTLKILSCPKLLSLPQGMNQLNTLRELKIKDCGALV